MFLTILMRTFFNPWLIFLLVSLLSGCNHDKKETFHIGFSQCASDVWREKMNEEMKMTAALYPDVELTILNAGENNRRQELQIRELINQGVDLLIISPNESDPLTPIATEAYTAGIPTILIDRKINSEDYTAFIGADNYQIGKDVAVYLANIHGGKGRILEIRGMEGSSPARERHQGFTEGLKPFKEMKIVRSMDGKWLPGIARDVARQAFLEDSFDIVFGHNDVMARSAREVAEMLNIDTLFVVGIDALPELGMELVEEDVLQASFVYPTGGRRAIEVARAILHDEPYQKHNILGTSVVDHSNVKVLRLQLEQVMAFQEILDAQTTRIREQTQRFQDQRSLLRVAFISLSLLVVFAVWLTWYYVMLNKRNRQLAVKNRAIEKQKAELERRNEQIRAMNEEVEKATQAKLSFFTNISHEIRTPLTLIQAPVSEMLGQISENRHKEGFKENLVMVQQNTERLLRLINQLMDFRKVELGKLSLNISKANLKEIANNIFKAFQPLARQKDIRFNFKCTAPHCMVWMDVDKIDKVLFNLLSNAFKFTPRAGSILLKVNCQETDEVVIEISDTGPGIPPEKQAQIFQPFYQQQKHRSMGTGIGLTLSRGFMELHKGTIEVISDGQNGTTFKVKLPKGLDHFSTDQVISEPRERTSTSFIENQPRKPAEISPLPKTTARPSLLIVEDDAQLKQYLIRLLEKQYFIKSAGNGKEALQIIELEQPDLVLTDLMMPEMDGSQLTTHLKSHLETSHLPVIMLTAKVSPEQKIEGIETGADAYIEKPFNPDYLKVRIRKIIEMREKLRAYHRQKWNMPGAVPPHAEASSLDQRFLRKMHAILESNHARTEFSVEELSEQIGLSRVHLYRKVKALTTLSPSDYINKFRLHKSLALLEEQGGNISGVSMDVGFSSPAYFTKKFREEFGKTPSEYLNRET